MKLLLDTHTFIWWDSSPQKLSRKALALCQNPENILLLSMASIWEIQIKLQLGKLSLNREHLTFAAKLEIGVRSQESGVRRKEEEGRRKEPEEVFLQI